MYYVISNIDGVHEIAPFKVMTDAEGFAQDVAAEGYECEIVLVMRRLEATDSPYIAPHDMERHNGVRAGLDFPATLTR